MPILNRFHQSALALRGKTVYWCGKRKEFGNRVTCHVAGTDGGGGNIQAVSLGASGFIGRYFKALNLHGIIQGALTDFFSRPLCSQCQNISDTFTFYYFLEQHIGGLMIAPNQVQPVDIDYLSLILVRK